METGICTKSLLIIYLFSIVEESSLAENEDRGAGVGNGRLSAFPTNRTSWCEPVYINYFHLQIRPLGRQISVILNFGVNQNPAGAKYEEYGIWFKLRKISFHPFCVPLKKIKMPSLVF